MKQLPQALKLESGIEVLLILVVIIVAYKLWILPLHESLWMDETIGYWAIQGGFWEIFPRTALWIAQSVLHHLIAWGFVTVTGQWNEVIFRLPSVIAVVVASFLLYDLGVHLLNRRAALYATGMFITFDLVAFAATNGRPYGLALLAIISALLFLVRWLKFGRLRDCVGYSLTASATIHLHYLFATMFLIHILYAALVLKSTEGLKATRRQLAYAVLVITVSLLPLLPKVLKLFERGHELTYAPTPTAVGLVALFFFP